MTSNLNGTISKTRGELLREKVNNFCNYLYDLQPESKKDIDMMRHLSNEEIVLYICQEILPLEDKAHVLVKDWIKYYNITPTSEIEHKLMRYCQFFCKFMKN